MYLSAGQATGVGSVGGTVSLAGGGSASTGGDVRLLSGSGEVVSGNIVIASNAGLEDSAIGNVEIGGSSGSVVATKQQRA